MPRKANEIAVKWLESRDAGKTNRVNVKHIVGQLSEIVVGTEVVVRFNSKRYRATVDDLLDWAPPPKKTKPSKKPTLEKEIEKSTKEKAAKETEIDKPAKKEETEKDKPAKKKDTEKEKPAKKKEKPTKEKESAKVYSLF